VGVSFVGGLELGLKCALCATGVNAPGYRGVGWPPIDIGGYGGALVFFWGAPTDVGGYGGGQECPSHGVGEIFVTLERRSGRRDVCRARLGFCNSRTCSADWPVDVAGGWDGMPSIRGG
jgi:hypothetical protein